jgi:hypothetical protein
MKTILLAALFAIGIGLAGATGAFAAEGGAPAINKAADGYTLTLHARRYCRWVTVCKRHWWPHCRTVRVCRSYWW